MKKFLPFKGFQVDGESSASWCRLNESRTTPEARSPTTDVAQAKMMERDDLRLICFEGQFC